MLEVVVVRVVVRAIGVLVVIGATVATALKFRSIIIYFHVGKQQQQQQPIKKKKKKKPPSLHFLPQVFPRETVPLFL